MDKAIRNIVSNVHNVDNSYAHAIAAYALQLSDHPKKDAILDDLVTKSIEKGNKADLGMRIFLVTIDFRID